MDLSQFLEHRRSRWQRLTDLLDRVDRVGLGGLSPQETDELFTLYRLASSDLNLAQTRTSNPTVLEYLEGLVGRAYANLSVPKRTSVLRSWWMIVRNYFPATIRAEWRMLLVTVTITLAGMIFGAVMTHYFPDTAETFLPAGNVAMTPKEHQAEREEAERLGHRSVQTVGGNAEFSAFLANNNIRVTLLGFALGLTFGIGTAAVLFYNSGVMLGSILMRYWDGGAFTFCIAWIGPHGVIEIPCVMIGSMAGLMLARAQFRRDGGPLLAQIREMRPALVDLVVGISTLLILAALIEGGFSQVNEPTIKYWFKITVAVVLFAMLCAYLFWIPVLPRPKSEEDELKRMVEE